VPADADLGPVLLETIFNGTASYLPSSANGTWEIYSQIVVIVNIETPLSVSQNTTIDGFVGDNQIGPIAGLNVNLVIEGIEIGTAITDANGNFSLFWQVPNTFTDGSHELIATVPAQGWYRAGEGNTTFFLAHRTGMSFNIADIDATRLDSWQITGSLYDLDTATNDGLPGETIEVYLDGISVGNDVTSISGEWSISIIASESLSRGSHNISFVFVGSPGHLPVSDNGTVRVWADVTIHIDSISNYSVRSDSINSPIIITGRVTEIGGQGVMIDDATLILGDGADCDGLNSDSKCIVVSSIIWNGGVFTMTAVAPSWLDPGIIQLNVGTPENSTLFLRESNTWTNSFRLSIDANFKASVEPIIEGEQEVVMGEVVVTAKDTGDGVANIPITIYVEDSNGTRLDEMTVVTDEDGRAIFEFNAEPPYGNVSEYGEIVLKMTASDNNGIISDSSLLQFNSQLSSGLSPDYTYADEDSDIPWWAYVIAALIIAAAVGIIIMRRRASEAAKELADIFSYTAELLAAGDSMREAIFNCYESLVYVLLGRGFLRRDFETVREFEMAIRKALPGISEDALVGLDSIFEEARYSRHEMNEQHKIGAQEALSRVVNEINSGIEIPSR
jgi:hypothetical protein